MVTNLSKVLGVVGTAFGILSPFIIGFALAFILNKPFVFFRDKVLSVLVDKKKKKERVGLRSVSYTHLPSFFADNYYMRSYYK